MNIHEYQAKEILKKFGLPILNGKSYEKNLDFLETELKDLKGPPWVVKSQIHAGGRGAGYFKNSFNDKGGVQVIFEKDQVNKIASSMMGNVLVTNQTGEIGKTVNRIFIEEGCEIEREFFLSLIIDRNNSQLMLMISAAGGINIEDVAEKNPEEIQEETKIESTISSSKKNVDEIKKVAVTKKEEKKDKKLAEKKENIKKKETSNKEKK